MTTTDVREVAADLGFDELGVARAEAYEATERHIRERRERGLFAGMKFTMAQPETSCHPETLLPGARSVVTAARCYWQPEAPLAPRARPPGALHVGRRLRASAHAARRPRPAARRLLPRARRRQPARRPRSRRPGRHRLLRQEHHADHAPPRLMGRPRHARHRRRARSDTCPARGLRRLHDLHRRVPDGRPRRAWDARRDEVPLLLDTGAGAGAGGLPLRARATGLRVRHLPGRLSLESRRREAARRSHGVGRRGMSTSSPGSRRTAGPSSTSTSGCTCRGTIRAGCGGTR